jgi:hypothetical protein
VPLAARRFWWGAVAGLLVLASAVSNLPRPWGWPLVAALALVALLIFDAHSVWERDQDATRVAAVREARASGE